MKEYLYLQSQPPLQGIMDLISLVATLRKILHTLHKYPNTLNVELTGRLSHMITISPYMKSLIKQCDHKAPTACPLVPTFSCYDTLQAGTVGTILYTKESNRARERGLTASSPDMASIVTKEDGGKEFTVWDPSNCERKDAIRVKQTTEDTVYKHIAVTSDGRHLVCICQTPFFSFEVYSLQRGDCIASRAEAEADDVHNLRYLTNSHMVVETESSVIKVYNIFQPKEIDGLRYFKSPVCITPNEKYFIGMKDGCLHIAQLQTGKVLTTFEGADDVVRVAVSGNNRRLLVGLATGVIHIYNLSSVHRNVNLRSIAEYPPKDMKEVYSHVVYGVEKRQMKVTGLMYSRDGSKFLADYDSRFGRMSILWDYHDVNLICLLEGNILGTKAVFNNDNSLILRYTPGSASKTTINIYRADDGHLLLTCDMKDAIHNILVSNANSLIAITISNTILVLNILQLLAANKFKKTITLDPYLTVSNSFRFPKFLADGNIVYSDDVIIPPFNYFDIHTNDMKSVDLSGFHSEYLNDFPQERMLSPDGKRLLYTFYSKSGPMPIQTENGEDDGEKTFMTAMTRTQTGQGQGQRKVEVLERKDTKARLANMQSTSNAKGRQSILRAFDITTGDLDYQINLENERFIHVTSTSLITKKTIHSTKSRGRVAYMINIYNISTGAHELSVMEDSNVVELMDDNTRLITLKGGELTHLTIYNILKSPPTQILRFNLKQALGQISVKKMATFALNHSHLLFTYTPLGVIGEERSYCLFDSQVASMYQPIIGVDGGFKDISQDGKIAIDKTLKIYDLETGTVLKQVVPHVGRGKVDMEARLSYDNRYVIWYDDRDQTLCVATNESKTEVIARCVVHKTSKQRHLNGRTTLRLSNCGRTIVVTDNEEFKVYSLRAQNDPLQKKVPRPSTAGFYRNNQVRAGYLLNRIMSVPIERSSPYEFQTHRESVISPLYA
jgi:WD40 repeat protein